MKKLAALMVLMAGILWGLIGIFVRRLNTLGFVSMEIVAIRAVVTALLMFMILFLTKREMLKIRWKDIWCFMGTGICSIVFFNFCYFKAITITSLSVAAVLLYTAPAIVMVLSVLLFHEKINGRKILAIIATFLGCVLVTGIVGTTESLDIKGVIIGLGAGLGYALYSIFSRYAIERGYHSLTITFYTFLFAMAGTVPFVDYSKIIHFARDGKNLVFFLVFGLLSTVLPYILYTLGLKEMENSQASIIASIEPVTATLLGVFVYHEAMSFQQILGVVFVLGAIVISNR